MGFSRQEYWSGLPFPSPGDIPDPGIKPVSPALTGHKEPLGKPIDVLNYRLKIYVSIWHSWAKYPNKIVYRSLLITLFDHMGDFGKYEILVNYNIIDRGVSAARQWHPARLRGDKSWEVGHACVRPLGGCVLGWAVAVLGQAARLWLRRA